MLFRSALLGGVRAVFGVDILQVPLVCLSLPLLVIVAIPDFDQPEAIFSRLTMSVKLTPDILIAIGIACVNALATQFYSLLNWGAISNIELSSQKKLLRRVGAVTSVILIVFVLLGLLHPISSPGSAWDNLMQQFTQLSLSTDLRSFIFSGFLTLGMASILLTTTDAVVVNCMLFAYDNLFNGNSKAIEKDRASLRKIRSIGAIIFSICFIVLCTINYLQPDPFYLLLSMAGGVSAFAPMIVIAGTLTKSKKALHVFNNNVVLLYFGIFIVSGIIDVILLAYKSSFVPYVGLSAFFLSGILSIILFLISKSK